ncbi:MAG: hypothetical protein M9951_15360 [Burkholderiaceae bacterium]|nr:hypothetical protein [Burkholderiaceae bacterium]
MTDKLRRRLLLASVALPAACAIPSPRPGTPLPAGSVAERIPRPGERWHYASRNGYNTVGRGTLVVEFREEMGRRIHEWLTPDGARLGAEIIDPQGRLLEDPAYGPPGIRFEEPVPWWPVPPATGAANLARTHYRIDGDSGRYDWSDYRRVGPLQQIRVPAGDFPCLLVERQIQFRHPDFTRLHSYRHDLTWYAPQLGRWVRREWRGHYYLPDDRGPTRFEEDWRIWELTGQEAAPVAG